MKNILLILMTLIILTSCSTWHENWARGRGWIDPDSALELRKEIENLPERLELPTPMISTIEQEVINTIDKVLADPEYIPSELEGKLMEAYIAQDGTLEKFTYLVDIYERHYLNKGGKIHPDRSLDEIIAEYYSLLTPIERAQIIPDEEVPTIEEVFLESQSE